MANFDVTSFFGTVDIALRAAQRAMGKTLFGANGLVSVEEVNGSIAYRSSVTGKAYTNVTKALSDAASIGVTGVSRVNVGTVIGGGLGQRGNRIGDLNGVAAAIADMMDPTGSNYSELRRMGISEDFMSRFRQQGFLQVLTIGEDSESGMTGTAQAIRNEVSKGRYPGRVSIDAKTGRVMQIGIDGEFLTTTQVYDVMSLANRNTMASAVLGNILETGTPEDMASKVAKLFKREKAFESERELSIAGRAVADFTDGRSMADSTLVLNPRQQKLAMILNRGNKKFTFGDAALDEYYLKFSKADPYLEFFTGLEDSIGEGVGNALSKSEERLLRDLLTDDITSGRFSGKGGTGQILDTIKSSGIFGNDQRAEEIAGRVQRIFKAIEHEVDGSYAINEKRYRAFIKADKDSLRSGNLTDEEVELVTSRIKQMEKALDGSGAGDDIVARIGFGGTQYKGAGHIFQFRKALSKYSFIVSDVISNTESGTMAGDDYITLSGFGKGKGPLYADVSMAAFNQDIVVSGDMLRSFEVNEARAAKELQGFIDTGMVSDDILRMISEQADQDIDLIEDVSKRGLALKNREFFREIQRAMQSGIPVNDIPGAFNMIAAQIRASAFREKGNAVMPAMPLGQRFSIDTESVMTADKNFKKLLTRNSREAIEIADETGSIVNAEVFNFRVKGKTMYLGEGRAVAALRHALGGFDLDDKGLPIVTTYSNASGERKLAFQALRQPGGTEENILLRANMDIETVKKMFGERKGFSEALDEMILDTANANTNDPMRRGLRLLREVIDSDDSLRVNRNKNIANMDLGGGIRAGEAGADRVESAIIAVMDRLNGGQQIQGLSKAYIRNVRDSGGKSSSLEVIDILSDEANYANRAFAGIETESGVISFKNEVLQAAQRRFDEGSISQQILDEVINATSQQEEQDFMRAYSNLYRTENSYRSILDEAISIKQVASVADGTENLGAFVNKSMIIGSMAGQFNEIQDLSPAARDIFMRHKIPILPQESAIDAAVTLSEGIRFRAQFMSASQQDAWAVELGEKLGADGISSLEDLGNYQLKQLGKIYGELLSIDEARGMGFASFLFDTGKMTNKNLSSILSGIGETVADQGMKDQISNVLSLDYDQQIAFFQQNFSIDKDNATFGIFERLSEANRRASFDAFNAKAKRAAGRMSMPQELISSYYETSQQSRDIASSILQRNSQNIEEFSEILSRLREAEGAESIFESNIRLSQISEGIFGDISAALELDDVTKGDLFTSLDYMLSKDYNVRGGQLIGAAVSDDAIKIAEEMFSVSEARFLKYQAARKSDVADEIMRMYNGQTVADLRTFAKDTLNTVQSSGMNLNNAQQAIVDALNVMAGRTDVVDAMEEGARRAAVANSVIANAKIRVETSEVRNALDLMAETGTVSRSGISAGSTLQDIVNETLDNTANTGRQATYKRMSKSLAEDFISKPGFRKGLAAAALTIGASFIYSASKDRTQDDMSGPQSLPGGSAYEQMPRRSLQLPDVGGQAYSQGATYNVSINGSYDNVQKFNEAASGLNNGNYSATMYNKIPNLGSNPLLGFLNNPIASYMESY